MHARSFVGETRAVFFFALASAFVLPACRDKAKPATATTPSASAVASSSSSPQAAPSASASATASEIHAFRGTVHTSRSLRLYVERHEGALRGVYAVDDEEPARLEGTARDATHWHLDDTTAAHGAKAQGVKAPAASFELVFDPATSALTGTVKDGASGATQNVEAKRSVPFGDAKGFTQAYAGSLGNKLRVRASLTREGGALHGSYRYARSKSDLPLQGTVDPHTGEADLTEGAAGKPSTGKMHGFFLDPHLFVGTWSSPDGARSLPLLLAAADAYPETLTLTGGARLVPQEEYAEPSKSCTSSILYPSIEGLADKAAQAKLDALLKTAATGGLALGKEDCESATPDLPFNVEGGYTAVAKKGFVGIDLAGNGFTGGAHGMVWEKCLVVDLAKGESVSLIGLFTAEARARLDALVEKKLESEHGVKDLTEAGFYDAHPKVSDTTNLCLRAGGGIDVEFGDYEIGPHVIGPQEASFTAAEIRPLLTPGPVTDALLAP